MARTPRQLTLLKTPPKEMGGVKLKGNPRHRRPMDSKRPLHLVLKSSLCKGRFSLLHPKFRKRVEATLRLYAQQNGIRIYRYQNVGNHLHVVLLSKRVNQYAKFVRAFSGRIAQTLLKEMGYDCLGGDPTKLQAHKQRFWDYRPFSRVVGWGKDFLAMKDYVLKNTLDAAGISRTSENLQALKRSLGILKSLEPPTTA